MVTKTKDKNEGVFGDGDHESILCGMLKIAGIIGLFLISGLFLFAFYKFFMQFEFVKIAISEWWKWFYNFD